MAGTPLVQVPSGADCIKETNHKDVNMSSPSKELGLPNGVPAEPMSPQERGAGIFSYECSPVSNGIDAEGSVKDPKVSR